MDTGLKGKVALVTGAGEGFGRASAIALGREGVTVGVGDINDKTVAATASAIQQDGATTAAFHMDVTQADQVTAAVEQMIESYGQLDILVANAGVVGPQGPWHDLTEDGFDRVCAINFKGVFLSAKAVIPHMIERGSGRIIIVSSCAGKTGEEYNGMYSATKAAIHNMTQSMSRELGQYNINVNAVCPAAMNTELMETVYRERSEYFSIDAESLRQRIRDGFKLPRALTVDDAAHVVVFLASDQTAMMTGQAVNITGGIEVH